MKRLLLLAMMFAVPASLSATDRYISPSGSGSTCLTGSPCAWATALAATIAGDRIIFKTGTYTARHLVSCGSNAVDGTQANPITLIAETERTAFLDVTGGDAIRLNNCDWYIIQGFRAEGSDSTNANDFWDLFGFYNSSNLTIRRNILRFSNRDFNVHLMAFNSGTQSNVLIEENEFYSFHRHAIMVKGGSGFVLRRNYCNDRDYLNASSGHACISLYPAMNTIVENNISENGLQFAELNGSGETALTDVQMLGNISLNDFQGIYPNARGDTLNEMPRNITIDNMLFLSPSGSYGVKLESAKNIIVRRSTLVDGASNAINANLLASPYAGDGAPSVAVESSILWNNNGWGVSCDAGQTACVVEFTRTHLNTSGTFTGTTSVSNNTTGLPDLGTCRAWQPAGSALLGAGKGGHDIGARILYRYTNGVLTSETLWNPTTGAFPAGAIITGWNDEATFPNDALEDIQGRLNINTGGCSFPPGYGGAGSPTLTMVWPYPANQIFQRPSSATMSIEWSATDVTGDIDMDYSTDGGTTWTYFATVDVGSSPYLFDANASKVPATTAFLIRISQGATQDFSDSAATVRGRYMK